MPNFIEYHCEDSGSCKNYRLELVELPGGANFRLDATYGPAESASTVPAGKTPAWKTQNNQRWHESGSPRAKVLDDLKRKHEEKIKKGYVITEHTLEPDVKALIGMGLSPGAAASATKAKVNPADALYDELMALIGPSVPNKVPILLDGPPGTGKTFTCRRLGTSGGYANKGEVAGNPAMEALDFLGGMVPIGDGKMIWQDGPVTLAFRQAARGGNVLLVVDELLRIPRRERGIFLNALSPHITPTGSYYMLRTGKPIVTDEKAGLAKMEILAAPCDNLAIVATTNSGSDYPDVENEDPAGRERWHVIHVQPQTEFLAELLERKCVERGFPQPFSKQVIQLQSAIAKVHTDNLCDKQLSPRLALRVLQFAKAPTKEALAEAARAMIPSLTGRTPDGSIIEEQQDAINTAINAALRIA